MTSTITEAAPLRVVHLEAENFKRLRAVEITPDPDQNVVTIAGRNAQGKSSVIDAIWAALANTAAAKGTNTSRPIRDGEDRARVSVDLGGLVVTRTWAGEKTTLTVTSADGAKYNSPQRMLDDLIGSLSFDPLAFAGLPAKAQQAELLALVDLPFDPDRLADERGAVFAMRTETGRAVKQLQGQLDGLPAHDPTAPAEEVSAADLLGRINEARHAEREWDEASDAVEEAAHRVRVLKVDLEEAEDELKARSAEMSALTEPDENTVPTLERQVETIDATNARVRANADRARVANLLELERAHWQEQTDEIADLDRRRADGLAAAEFPVQGLGFDDGGVTYQGVPFGQASAAEQLRVSVAIAMALNPTVRVIRIADGSLLDADNLALIGEMAADRGYQVWVETVRDRGVDGPGILIEDGQVAGGAA
ncbi:AAA family ATPase [Tsukamurella pseudospumae]|uniref:Rad50/SbcC-type AAA domain-containing protein n=1 Tax=Tsukamurella pseudospumae TaxID=239498 RepID=A0A137ZRQ7_9ACTN|nr:AAA family ATPase [Tsukamurella pseudospumae]KXP00864.1 hypothetical protein AXK61_12710 [Tsukamurella pseudospumae]